MEASFEMSSVQIVEVLEQHAGDVILHGESLLYGVEGRASVRFDRMGRFVRRIESELGSIEAFNGESGWRTDPTGMPTPLELSNLERTQIETWVATGLWRSASLLEIELGSERLDENEVDYVLMARGGRDSATLTVARDSGIPLRLRTRAISGDVELVYTNHFESRGAWFPGRIERSTAGILESVLSFERVEWLDTKDSQAYSRRPERPQDHRFKATIGEIELRRAPTGHLLVRPEVDGKAGDWFIFDSGAGQSALAKSVTGLEQIGTGIVASIFGIAEEPVLRGSSLALGPLELSNPVFFTMELAPLEPYFGEPVGGIVGFDVLSRSVVEIDLESSLMRLHDPTSFELESGEWLPLRFQDNHPLLPARFAGGEGLFRLDLGASGGPHGNVVFHEPTTRELGLLDGQEVEESQLGEINVALGSLDWFELAGHRFESPEVVFGRDDHGIFSDSHTAGNVGVNFLSPFRIVMDYTRERIALVKRP